MPGDSTTRTLCRVKRSSGPWGLMVWCCPRTMIMFRQQEVTRCSELAMFPVQDAHTTPPHGDYCVSKNNPPIHQKHHQCSRKAENKTAGERAPHSMCHEGNQMRHDAEKRTLEPCKHRGARSAPHCVRARPLPKARAPLSETLC